MLHRNEERAALVCMPKSLLLALQAAVVIAVVQCSAYGQGLTYVDANDFLNLSPTSAINSGGAVGDDNLWGFRTLGAGGTVFEAGVGVEDVPQIAQTITGLTPGISYDLYTVFWTDGDENWTMRTGTSPGSLTTYSYAGAFGAPAVADSMIATSAAAAVWSVLPPANTTAQIFHEGPENDPTDRLMLLAKAGTVTANGSGEASVYVDDLPIGSSPGDRTWLDGVAYVAAGVPVALTATLDPVSGALTLTNPTSQAFQIKSYSITSVSGSLNATTWTPISGRLDGGPGGNGLFDSDNWDVTAPANPGSTTFTGVLSEAEVPQNNGGSLAAGGGSITFGNVYNKSRYQDVRLNLTLADDTLVTIVPAYAGAPIAPADFDLNGSITVADFQLMMSNMHTDISTLTLAAAHREGDINGDRQINFQDYRLFRDAYEAANGAGSFAGLAVPEPASAMLIACGMLAACRARRRAATCVVALVLCLSLAGVSQAQTLLAVDVDHRSGDTNGPDEPNTVAGFESFTLPAGTTGAQPSATAVLNGYTIGVTAVTAAGAPLTSGGMDDRERAGPTTAPTLNQLYDDFIFTAAAVGAGGGIDLTISGGALQPNRQYTVSIYAFDEGSTPAPQPRTANWLDGNDGNAIVLSTSFNGNAAPTSDSQYKFSGLARTDANGQLFLRGRNTVAGTTPGVFLNGFEIAIPIELSLEINTTTGAIQIKNEQSVNFDLSYYEIRSAAGSLDPAGWTSLDDANVGGADTWLEAGGSDANILSEGTLTSSQAFAPGSSISLGNGFSAGGAQDIRFYYAGPGDTQLRSGLVNFVSGGGIGADFNNDGVVNGGDLAKWKADFGAGAGSDADTDGDTDGNDFLIWQRSFGATSATEAVAAVPEPAAFALLALGACMFAASSRKRQQ